jgi:hypothetical protein
MVVDGDHASRLTGRGKRDFAAHFIEQRIGIRGNHAQAIRAASQKYVDENGPA